MINAWVSQQTAGKIPAIITPDLIQEQTRFVLTSAIYFKGTWKYTFPKTSTVDEPFFLAKDRELKVPTMKLTGALPYADAADAQLLELPYVGDRLSMLILLPKNIDALAEVEKSLSAATLQKRVAGLHEVDEVQVALPKFTFTSQLALKELLSSLGMPAAFSDDAEFPGISTEKAQKLDAVLHHAFVDVNEEGTEAAAVTGHIGGNAPGPVPTSAVFRADHPFLFLIQDKRTGAILFVGRVVNPKG